MQIAVHTESKVRSSDHDRQRSVRMVMHAAKRLGSSRLMPVLHRQKIAAWVGWSSTDDQTYVIDHKPWMRTWIDDRGLLCGFNSVDDLISKVTKSGQMRQNVFGYNNRGGTPFTDWVHWYTCGNGNVPAGVFNGTAYTARQHSDADLGALMHGGNVSPATKHLISAYIVQQQTVTTDCHVYVVYDMVLSYDQSTVKVTSQAFTNTLTAQRYIGTSDPGLQIMGAASTGANTLYTNLKYTNIGGTGGQTCPLPTNFENLNQTVTGIGVALNTCFGVAHPGGARAGMLCAPLVNGDSGAKQLDSVQMNATTTDNHNYILGQPLAWIPIFGGNEYTYSLDLVKQIASLPRIVDGACLVLASMKSTTASNAFNGGFNVAWG